jgi:segregation and condensation protein A
MPEIENNPAAQLVFELEAFDGPLDLLLFLIRKDEVDIYDIPIAEITRQYLSYVEACRELNLEVAGEFLFMASMLIRIKAQMLLPRHDDEELDDPRSELVNALLEYKKIKQTSTMLEDLAETQAKRFPRCDYAISDLPKPEPELVRVDVTALMIAFGDLLRRMPKDEAIYQIRPQEITVEMRKERILAFLDCKNSLEFDELFSDDPRKIVMVVTFMAILELVKEGILKVEQASRFSPIRLLKGELEDAILTENV